VFNQARLESTHLLIFKAHQVHYMYIIYHVTESMADFSESKVPGLCSDLHGPPKFIHW
jgi:hypothetical protein